jgi:hypothetical protein
MKPIINRKSGPVINIKWIKRSELDFINLNRLQSPIHRDALTQPIEEIASSTGLEICLMIEQLESKEEIAPFQYVNEEEDEKVDRVDRKRSRTPEDKKKSPNRNRSKEYRNSKQRNSPRSKQRSKEKVKMRR